MNFDDLVRMAVLQGSAGLQSLLTLLSVLGGLHQMGVLGMFIEPAVAGILIALLRIPKQQLDQLDETFPPGLRAAAHEETAVAITIHEEPSS